MTTDSVLPNVVTPAFFAGQRLTPADLTTGQDYHREMRWLHNRSLHAWGIALGLLPTGARGAKDVRVEPGYALDHLGRELVLSEGLTVAVPPVAGDVADSPVDFYLTISYVEDPQARRIESRNGVCAGEGAVRLADRPLIRWQRVYGSGGGTEDDLRPGLDVVLASAPVRNCRLDAPLSLVERRDARPSTQPYVAGGATGEQNTAWQIWHQDDKPANQVLGIRTDVDTSSGRFRATPSYLVQFAGERQYSGNVFFEGFVRIDPVETSSTGFTLRLFMPEHQLSSGWRLNSRSVLNQENLPTLAKTMQWHVVWMGVEG